MVLLEPERVASPTLHVTILFTISVFFIVIIMSVIFTVEVVARGQGRVVPISRVQVVQPEFSGRIKAIHVKNGMAVTQGDLLIELDKTEAAAALAKVQAEQDRLLIESARIDAVLSALIPSGTSTDLHRAGLQAFSLPEALRGHPFAEEQRRLLKAELEDFLASEAQIGARAEASRRSEVVTAANIDRVAAALAIQAERLANATRLLEQGATSRSALRDVQQAFTELERQRDVYLAECNRKRQRGWPSTRNDGVSPQT